MRRRARVAALGVALSALALGACSDDADEPERAELRPVAQSRAPDTPVIDREAAVPREVRERPRRRSRRRRADGVQKAAVGGAPRRAAASAPTPVASTPAPAPQATPAPPRQPAATPSKPSGGGAQARAKPREVECSPRCP